MNEIALSAVVGVLGLACAGLVALYYRRKMRRFRSQLRKGVKSAVDSC